MLLKGFLSHGFPVIDATQVVGVSSSTVGLQDEEYGATMPINWENRWVPNSGRLAIKLKRFTYEVRCLVPFVNTVNRTNGVARVIATRVFRVVMVMNIGHVISDFIASIF